MKIRLNISGMSCVNCANAITRATQKIQGVKSANVSIADNSGVFELEKGFFAGQIQNEIKEKIKRLGFVATSDYNEFLKAQKLEFSALKVKFIICVFCTLCVMFFHFAMLFGKHYQMGDIFSLAAATICVIFCGSHFFTHAIKSLKERNFDMNTLVSLGVLSAYFYSLFLFFYSKFTTLNFLNLENLNLYFDSPVMIITFVLFGKVLESKAKAKSSNELLNLISLMPQRATIIEPNGVNKEIKASELKIDDIIVIKAGQIVPSDAIIISGSAQLNEASINGESLPKFKGVGERIFAGTINENGLISAKIDKKPNESVLASIIENLQSSATAKLNIARLSDKISNIFVPFVILISVLTLVCWSFVDIFRGLNFAISVLVISCPCALGLAVPIALVCAISRAFKNGILIKNPSILEQISKINLVLFDKTGTLTKGALSVEFSSLDDENYALFSSLCATSTHPIAQAIAKAKNSKNSSDFKELKFLAGLGIECYYNGEKLVLGNEKLLNQNGIFLDENQKATLGQGILVLCARNSQYLGYILLNDELKENTNELIKELKKYNLKSVLLSGDNEKSVEKIAAKLEIKDFYAELLPQQKADLLSEFSKNNKVLFVGDGINDALALKNADISIAVGDSSDIAKNACDIVLVNNDIMGILKTFELGKRTLKIIKQNLFWAFCYNSICIPLATGAFSAFNLALNPAISAFAMSVSSIIVVLNSLRLLKD